jgi:hypothetical protein
MTARSQDVQPISPGLCQAMETCCRSLSGFLFASFAATRERMGNPRIRNAAIGKVEAQVANVQVTIR